MTKLLLASAFAAAAFLGAAAPAQASTVKSGHSATVDDAADAQGTIPQLDPLLQKPVLD